MTALPPEPKGGLIVTRRLTAALTALLAAVALSTGTASASLKQAEKINTLQQRVQDLHDRTDQMDARRAELRRQRDAAVGAWRVLDRTIWSYDYYVAPLPTEIVQAQRAAWDLISEALQGESAIVLPHQNAARSAASAEQR